MTSDPTTASASSSGSDDGQGSDPSSTEPSDTAAAEPLGSARAPVGTGLSPLFGQLLALGLIALGVVGIEEALVRSGALDTTSWISHTVVQLDQRSAPQWFLVAGIAAGLIGLALILVALRRRPRKTLSVRAETGVYLKTSDLARLAAARLEGLDGVTGSDVDAARRRLDVVVRTIAAKDSNPAIEQEVRERLAPCLDHLERAPRVKVAIRNEDFA